MSISFQGYVPQSEKKRNTQWAIIGAPIITASEILTEAIVDKDLRKDSFVKTAKESAKVFTKDCKNLAAGFCKYILRNDKLADRVFKMANNDKRIFAVGVLVDALATFGILKMVMDFGSKFHHRKD